MAYSYPGQAFYHTLTALKGWYKQSALDAEVALSSNVNIGSNNSPAVQGLVVHSTSWTANSDPYGGTMNGPGTLVVEMGCGSGHGPAMYLWTPPTDPDAYNPGVPAGVAAGGTTDNVADYFPVFPPIGSPSTFVPNLTALVSLGGYEVETTEYDTAQTFLSGQGLRSVTSNTDADAGKVTNQRGTTAAFNSAGVCQFGDPTLSAWDTIVGFVSRGTYVNANKRNALAYWTAFIPGTR